MDSWTAALNARDWRQACDLSVDFPGASPRGSCETLASEAFGRSRVYARQAASNAQQYDIEAAGVRSSRVIVEATATGPKVHWEYTALR